jgi:protein SCO1/2
MHDPRHPGIDPDTLLIAAAIGLALWLVAGFLYAQGLPAGTSLGPADALRISQGAVGRSIGDYELQLRDGTKLRLANYRGKPLIVQFIYTGCFQVCPTTTRFLGRAVDEAQRELGKDAFHVVTVGFNLPFDTPAAMDEFRKKQEIDFPNWAFAAADSATIDGLARDVGFAWTPTTAGFDHLTQATIIDARGRVFRQVYGESFELPMFVGPLMELATGAPAPTQNLSQLLERVRILCTVYDPRTGKYRLNFGVLIEILVGLSVLGSVAWYLVAGARRGYLDRKSAERGPHTA